MTEHRRVSLLHTSDVHLGWDSNPLLVKRAFTAVINTAHKLDVDIVIVAGDLFDHARVENDVIAFALAEMNRAGRQVIVLPGNHDVYDATSVYHRVDVEAECPNVKLIRGQAGELVRLPDKGVTFWGKAMEEHHPGFHPLADVPARDNGDWFVGVAHGHFEPSGAVSGRSSPIYPAEIAGAGCDYVALGHWHIPLDISQQGVRCRYSGSPAGSGFSDTLGEVSIVEFDPVEGVTVRSQPLEDRPPQPMDDED